MDLWVLARTDGRHSTEAEDHQEGALARLLRLREGDIERGLPVTPKTSGRLRFEEAAGDVATDYRVNGKRTLEDVERRIAKHLTPFFGSRRMATITTADVRAYIAKRQADTTAVWQAHHVKQSDGKVRHVPEQRRAITGASNAEINRELAILKRAFRLALQAGKLLHVPYVPMLREDNVRSGFFEAKEDEAVAGGPAAIATTCGDVRLPHRLAHPLAGTPDAVGTSGSARARRSASSPARRRTPTDGPCPTARLRTWLR